MHVCMYVCMFPRKTNNKDKNSYKSYVCKQNSKLKKIWRMNYCQEVLIYTPAMMLKEETVMGISTVAYNIK